MNKRVLLIEHTSGEFIISRLKLGTFLMEKGYRVAALVPEGNSEDLKRIEASGIEVFTFPYERNMTGLGSTLKVISLFRT